jgi:hypothetical protein
MKKSLIAIIALAIVALAAIIFGIATMSSSNTVYLTLTAVSQKLNNVQSNSTVLQKTATAFADDRNIYEGQLILTQESLEMDNSSLQSQIDDIQSSANCTNHPQNIDFTSNSTVADSLKKWIIYDTQENVTSATWDTVWNNSETAIFNIKGDHLYPFLVYFDEPAYNHQQSIFDFTNMCWLYPPGL